MLAITFTKDAAAEIRDRVRRALIEEGMDEEALTVDDAWISTIHGMCSRILRAHALELGIDPEDVYKRQLSSWRARCCLSRLPSCLSTASAICAFAGSAPAKIGKLSLIHIFSPLAEELLHTDHHAWTMPNEGAC